MTDEDTLPGPCERTYPGPCEMHADHHTCIRAHRHDNAHWCMCSLVWATADRAPKKKPRRSPQARKAQA